MSKLKPFTVAIRGRGRLLGLVVADGMRAYPKSTWYDYSDAMKRAVAQEHQIAAFIIGLPLNMDGSEGPRVQSTKAFARNLSGLTDLPMIFWDERLSTQAAERTLLEADSSRKRRQEVIDKMAATYILQGALDRLQSLRQEQ